jgi:hypothetical protein
VGGAAFTLRIPGVTIGWFTISGLSRTYSIGKGC